MNLSNRVLSKTSLSWTDVQKQLFNAIQTRSSGGGGGANLSSTNTGTTTALCTIAINKSMVKQCTDILIKHIKSKWFILLINIQKTVVFNQFKFQDLDQNQVIEQLETLAHSSGLMIYKTPSEEPHTINAFLTADDFFFEVSVNKAGIITDVKFSIFSEPAQVGIIFVFS